MGPYVPRVDYTPLAQGQGLPEPALTTSSQLPNPSYCSIFPSSAPKLNTPSATNQVSWPTYWPNQGDQTGEPLVCSTQSIPQAAPSFASGPPETTASEVYSADCGQAVGYCNSVNYLWEQTDAFTLATPPPVPIAIVGTGFGYLPQQILPFAGPASSLITSGGASVLQIQDYPGPSGTAWNTTDNPACQLYVANWNDEGISLDVNLPTNETNGLGFALSPLSDFSPMTLFFPDTESGASTQQCPVASGDTLIITVSNAQGGGTSSAGPICVQVGTAGPINCPAN